MSKLRLPLVITPWIKFEDNTDPPQMPRKFKVIKAAPVSDAMPKCSYCKNKTPNKVTFVLEYMDGSISKRFISIRSICSEPCKVAFMFKKGWA